jgi:D-xylose transport system substrate-binding protein
MNAKPLKTIAGLVVLGALMAAGQAGSAAAKDLVVGVSWSNFQEERWKTDEAAIKAELAKQGATYVSADAQSSPAKQATDIETLISRGANALIILAQDAASVGPGVRSALDQGIAVIGYDRLIETPGAFYLTFDNKEVGRLQAATVYKAQPKGNYVFIKGASSDPNADFLFAGQMEALKAAIDRGDIKVVGNDYTDAWLPANAQRNMEQILTRTGNKVDAVVASNDGTAGGVIAALTAQGMAGIPVSGQDGDHAALNRIALGTQTVSVWKDARELGKDAADVAVALAKGGKPESLPGVQSWTSPKGTTMSARFLVPVPITKNNLDIVVKAGWITKVELCQNVAKGKVPACD